MKPNFLGQTNFGGECMNQQEITLGQVTYEVCRVFTGSCPATELVLQQLAQRKKGNPSFDERRADIV